MAAVMQPPFKFWYATDHLGHSIPVPKGQPFMGCCNFWVMFLCMVFSTFCCRTPVNHSITKGLHALLDGLVLADREHFSEPTAKSRAHSINKHTLTNLQYVLASFTF
jgi:hypothetical protein